MNIELPKGAQGYPKDPKRAKGTQSEPRAPQRESNGNQKGAKTTPEGAKGSPRAPQREPKGAQEHAKEAKGPAKGPKATPKEAKGTPKTPKANQQDKIYISNSRSTAQADVMFTVSTVWERSGLWIYAYIGVP